MSDDRTTRNVPAAALRFSAGPVEFAASAGGGDSKNVKVRLVARSGKPIEHWYWGRIVHDFTGMRRHKDRLPLDYAHYDTEVIGYADQFRLKKEHDDELDADVPHLEVSGELVPFSDGDRANEILHKSAAGVPYESSIFAPPHLIEELGQNQVAKVNGYELTGPALIIREWDLRGIALCPYGADKNTPVSLNSQAGEVEVSFLQHTEAPMAKSNDKPVPPAENAPDTKPPAAPEKPAEQHSATQQGAAAPESPPAENAASTPAEKAGKDFLAAFGAQGGVWFAEGKTFEEAQRLHVEALTAENASLKQKLAAVGQLGEKAGLSMDPPHDPAPGQELKAGQADPAKVGRFADLGEGMAKVAAAQKVPGR